MLLSFGRLPYVNVQKFVSNKNLAHLLVLPLGLEGLFFLCVAWKIVENTHIRAMNQQHSKQTTTFNDLSHTC